MPESTKNDKNTGFALVAKRLAGWTSNLLVTAIVIVAALTFGRQLTYWWATNPDDAHENPQRSGGHVESPLLASEQATHLVDFGDLPLAMGRRSLAGDKDSVFATLRQECRAAVGQGLSSTRTPGPMETRMLRRTAELNPVEQEPDNWSMYQLDGPIPMVVVVQDSPQRVAETGQRVLSWGLAFPIESEGNQWTLFTCVPTDGSSAFTVDLPKVPTPPGGRCVMSLRTGNGGAIVCFAGEGGSQDWLRFFEDWFQQQQWSTSEGWQTTGGMSHCRFQHADKNTAVQIAVEYRGHLIAIMTITPQ